MDAAQDFVLAAEEELKDTEFVIHSKEMISEIVQHICSLTSVSPPLVCDDSPPNDVFFLASLTGTVQPAPSTPFPLRLGYSPVSQAGCACAHQLVRSGVPCSAEDATALSASFRTLYETHVLGGSQAATDADTEADTEADTSTDTDTVADSSATNTDIEENTVTDTGTVTDSSASGTDTDTNTDTVTDTNTDIDTDTVTKADDDKARHAHLSPENTQQFDSSNHFTVLGLSSTGIRPGTNEAYDSSDIKKAYRGLARQYHPDKNTHSRQRATEITARINHSCDELLRRQGPTQAEDAETFTAHFQQHGFHFSSDASGSSFSFSFSF
jgi:hypothetical protein